MVAAVQSELSQSPKRSSLSSLQEVFSQSRVKKSPLQLCEEKFIVKSPTSQEEAQEKNSDDYTDSHRDEIRANE